DPHRHPRGTPRQPLTASPSLFKCLDALDPVVTGDGAVFEAGGNPDAVRRLEPLVVEADATAQHEQPLVMRMAVRCEDRMRSGGPSLRVEPGVAQRALRRPLERETRDQPSAASIRAAMMKSLRVRPPAACVVSLMWRPPQPTVRSG